MNTAVNSMFYELFVSLSTDLFFLNDEKFDFDVSLSPAR